uniref:ribosomal protein L5 n=1 Tax=Choristocarpus tenellus TaxID=116065 RepID=UPI002E773E42|nr:ribosomal protein L5 [Choristocarpus tenellus]WBP69809.1 ribosomal protein L5 [Choristocarpus tenellus]
MYIFSNHYHEVIQSDFLLVQPSIGLYSFPNINKIVISLGSDIQSEDKILSSLCFLDLLGCQKPFLTRIRISSKSKFLNKGSVIGGKSTLRRSSIYSFLHKILFGFLPKVRQFEGLPLLKHPKTFSFIVQDLFIFEDLSFLFSFFEDLGPLFIDFTFYSKNIEQTFFFNSKFPILYSRK